MTTPPAPDTLPFDEARALRVFDELDRRFFDPVQGAWPEDSPYGTCTYVNALPIPELERQGHRCEMFGKSEEDFAGQPWITEYQNVTGHDWTVVDGRWLVDLWIKPYLGLERAVFDLQHEGDRDQVEHLYGDRSGWRTADPEHVRRRLVQPELFKEILAAIEPPRPAPDEERLAMHQLPCPATAPAKAAGAVPLMD